MPAQKQAAKKKEKNTARIHNIMLDGREQEDMTHYRVPVTPDTLTAYKIVNKYRCFMCQKQQEMQRD